MGNKVPVFNTMVINYWGRVGRELVYFVFFNVFSSKLSALLEGSLQLNTLYFNKK